MVSNIVGHASNGDLEEPMKERVVEYWTNVDPDLGSRVAEGLGVQAATASKK
jgi:catalase